MVIDAQVKLMERLSSPVRQSFHLILETFPKTFIHRCGKRAKLSQEILQVKTPKFWFWEEREHETTISPFCFFGLRYRLFEPTLEIFQIFGKLNEMEYRGCLISLMSLLEVTFFIKLTGRTTTLRLQVQSSCRVFAFA